MARFDLIAANVLRDWIVMDLQLGRVESLLNPERSIQGEYRNYPYYTGGLGIGCGAQTSITMGTTAMQGEK